MSRRRSSSPSRRPDRASVIAHIVSGLPLPLQWGLALLIFGGGLAGLRSPSERPADRGRGRGALWRRRPGRELDVQPRAAGGGAVPCAHRVARSRSRGRRAADAHGVRRAGVRAGWSLRRSPSTTSRSSSTACRHRRSTSGTCRSDLSPGPSHRRGRARRPQATRRSIRPRPFKETITVVAGRGPGRPGAC